MILRDHEDSENSLKKRVPMHCLQHKGEEAESQKSVHQMQQEAAWRMLP
jgi:hypothetical protein